jgi:hypothetical protein
VKPFLQDKCLSSRLHIPVDSPAELPISSEYASFLIRLWRVPGGEAGMLEPGWRSEVEHIQSGGRWEISGLRELEQFLRDFLRQLGGV